MEKGKVLSGKNLLRFFWILIDVSFVAWILGIINHPQGHQMDLFFERMNDFWSDATNTTGYVSELDPYHNETNGLGNHNYPPLAYLLFYGLASVTIDPHIYQGGIVAKGFGGYLSYYYQPTWTFLFVIALIISHISLSIICSKNLTLESDFEKAMISLSLIISAPMLYTIERGNILVLSVLTTSFFIFYYDDNCRWRKEIALFFLSFAVNIKLSPAIFAILLVLKKDWKALFRTVCYVFLLFFLPFFFFKGGIQNVFQLLINIKHWFSNDIDFVVIHGTSLLSSYYHFGKYLFNESFKISKEAYSSLTVIRSIIALLLFLGTFQIKEKWKIVLNLIIILLILPSVSYAYNFLYMLPFTVLFFNSLLKDKISVDKITIFCSLIMIYFVYRCSLTDFFNYLFALPILTALGLIYSVQAFIIAKHIWPLDFLNKK